MLAMFAVGVMNVVWMVALGLVMTAEKLMLTGRFSRLIGAIFVAIGVLLVGVAIVLAIEMASLLIGEAASPDDIATISNARSISLRAICSSSASIC